MDESKNEYDVMPSMGLYYTHLRDIKQTPNAVDMTACKEICRAYGFECGYISGWHKHFIVYHSTDYPSSIIL